MYLSVCLYIYIYLSLSISLYIYICFSLEWFREFDRYRQSNNKNDKKCQRTVIRELGSDNRILAVFINGAPQASRCIPASIYF